MGGGYEPNDGRIAGKQHGWHFALVNEEANVVPSDYETSEPHSNPFGKPYLSISPDDPELSSPFLPDYDSMNGGNALHGSFCLPPGAVTAYGMLKPWYSLEHLMSDEPSGNLPLSSAIMANGYPPYTQRQQLLNFIVPEHAIPPLLVSEQSPLARLYVGFKEAALEQIGNGSTTVPELLGDLDLIYVDLLFRPRLADDRINVCNWACELVKNLPGFDLFVQLAWAGFLAKLMRVSLVDADTRTTLRLTHSLLVVHQSDR